MKLILSVVLQSGLVLALAAGASAQTGAFGILGNRSPANSVKGQPYSAEEITEHVQTLADGTRLTPPPQHSIYFRDSEGRTRTERAFAPPSGAVIKAPPNFVEIYDPVAGYRYNLDNVSHIARRTKLKALSPPPAPPQGAVIAARRAVGPVVAADAQRVRPETSSESLGAQMMEGVTVTGSRVTNTFPIGFFGNDRPITTVTETWMSAELGRAVLSRTSDPRMGENTTRLTNISRAEPDPYLFQIPADYEIRDFSPGPN